MKPTEPLAVDLLLSADERRPLSVAGHHEWRESLAASSREFDEIDIELDATDELEKGQGALGVLPRTAALEVMNADHVRTARAKGLAERTVVLKHVLRNALIPVVTLIVAVLGSIYTGIATATEAAAMVRVAVDVGSGMGANPWFRC